MSRRGVIAGAIAGSLGGAGPDAVLAQRRRMIVDAQVHLWRPETPDWKWVPGIQPHLPEPLTVERLLPLMDEARVDRVIVVPPSWTGDRNDYGLEAARRYPDRFAVMGRIAVGNPKSAELLGQWKQQPGMLGIRLTFTGRSGAWLTDGTTDWFWPAAEKAGIPVMFLAPGNLPLFPRIAERHPGLALIVDHIGMGLPGGNAQATEDTLALARFANLSVKMKAGPQYSAEPYPYRDLYQHLRRVFDAFGPQRCHWETDLTNSFGKATYRQRVTHFTEALDFLSEQDKDWVMGRAILTRLGWQA